MFRHAWMLWLCSACAVTTGERGLELAGAPALLGRVTESDIVARHGEGEHSQKGRFSTRQYGWARGSVPGFGRLDVRISMLFFRDAALNGYLVISNLEEERVTVTPSALAGLRAGASPAEVETALGVPLGRFLSPNELSPDAPESLEYWVWTKTTQTELGVLGVPELSEMYMVVFDEGRYNGVWCAWERPPGETKARDDCFARNTQRAMLALSGH